MNDTSDLRQKFVIADGEIIIGRVTFHKQLHSSPLGGGSWFYDAEERILYLYGTSTDFGSVTKEQVANSVVRKRPFDSAPIVFEENPIRTIFDILKDHMGAHRALELVTSNAFI